jgi:Uma2 family endonuclease
MTFTITSKHPEINSLEEWLENPPQGTEWVDGQLRYKNAEVQIQDETIEVNGMTLKHSNTQANLATRWTNYKDQHEPGGQVYTEAPCKTKKQGRNPDVAYLPENLVVQYGNAKVLPQSFPLSAEVVSPTDFAEDVIAKAHEYLQSGGEEVWLIFPECRWVIAITQESRQIFISGEVVRTQKVLLGFSIAVDDLLK